MHFRQLFSSRAELKSLVAIKLQNHDSFAFIGAIKQDIEDILTKAMKKKFLAADLNVKHSFSCFFEMVLTDTAHHGFF